MKKKKQIGTKPADRIQIELFTPQEVKLKKRFYAHVAKKGLSRKFVVLGLIEDYMRAQKF